MKGDTIWYFIANLIAYMFLYIGCIVVVVVTIDNIISIIILLFILLIACGFLEEHVISKYINSLVEKIINRK